MHRRPLIALALSSLLFAAACSDDGSKSNGSTPGSVTGSDPTLAPTTTFMPDCARMPTPEALTAIAGIPIDLGTVIATGTCEFRGVNDQTKVITLSLLSDPVDVAAFNDLQSSLGVPTPLNDPGVPNAMLGSDSTVFAVVGTEIYTVQTLITDAPLAEQVPMSLAVLGMWLKL